MSEPYVSPSTFRLRRRTPGTFVLVPNPKQGRSIRCQGQLEAAAAQILVACPLVNAIEEQPRRIWYAWNDQPNFIRLLDDPPTPMFRKAHRASYIIPDFLVTMREGRKRLVEVKPSSKLARPDVQRKLTVGRLFAEREGWSYHVVTERELFAGPLSANVRIVNRFRQANLDGLLLKKVETFVSPRATTLAALIHSFAAVDPTIVRTAALHLVAVGRLHFDPTAALISETTPFVPGGTFSWDPFDSVWGPSGSSTSEPIASSDRRVPTNSSPKT